MLYYATKNTVSGYFAVIPHLLFKVNAFTVNNIPFFNPDLLQKPRIYTPVPGVAPARTSIYAGNDRKD